MINFFKKMLGNKTHNEKESKKSYITKEPKKRTSLKETIKKEEKKKNIKFEPMSQDKIKNEYELFLKKMETTPVDLHDPNVQQIYVQACNFLALQSFKMIVDEICDHDEEAIEALYNDVLKLFFITVKRTLFRKLELNELIHDNNFSKDTLGDDLINRFNKCNNEKISAAITMAEKMIKKSLNAGGNANINNKNDTDNNDIDL